MLLAVFAGSHRAGGADRLGFTVDPNPAVSGVPATYTSTSTAEVTGFEVAGGRVDWDFDNDGD